MLIICHGKKLKEIFFPGGRGLGAMFYYDIIH